MKNKTALNVVFDLTLWYICSPKYNRSYTQVSEGLSIAGHRKAAQFLPAVPRFWFRLLSREQPRHTNQLLHVEFMIDKCSSVYGMRQGCCWSYCQTVPIKLLVVALCV